ncbi:MAG: DNA polymerase IV [Solirubrobacterales bacterium]
MGAGQARTIAHVDMDAFFVSVELLRRPELRGRPVIVATGTDPRARGVVMAASYEARRFGVHSALPLAVAHQRCPQAILVPRDFPRYREASARVMRLLDGYSDRVEIAGLDEAYLDLSDSPAPKARGRQLKREVLAATGLVCSVGLAPNMLVAKIASDLDKPDGFCVIGVEGFLDAAGERAANIIPGVGPKTADRLQRAGIKTVRDLASADQVLLEKAIGPTHGPALRSRANGHDSREVATERRAKSESRETTFSEDVRERSVLEETLERLTLDLCAGLESGEHSGRTVTLKIRLRPFRTYTRSRTLPQPTRDRSVVLAVAQDLLERFDPGDAVRLIGVGVSGLDHREQASESPPQDERGAVQLALGPAQPDAAAAA